MTKIRNLALAAAALTTLGAASLAPSEASAWGFRSHGFHHYHFGGYRYHWGFHRFGWHRPYFWHRYGYWPRHYYWRTGGAIGAPAYAASYANAGPTASAPAPVAARPSCIVKAYTPDGAVVFTDRCTKESAMNPPPAAEAEAGAPPAPR